MGFMELGTRLRQLRKSSGLGIKALAKKIKVNHSYLSRIESGTIQPSEQVIRKLSRVLAHDEDELMLLANRIPRTWRNVIKNSPQEATFVLRESIEEYKVTGASCDQLELFGTRVASSVKPSGNGGASSFDDPAFATNKSAPVHRWVPWIAGFSSNFVRGTLEKYLSHKGTVLDPFAGVGTTLVDAILSGYNATGFEINPYAALACRVKALSYQIPLKPLEEQILRFRRFCTTRILNGYVPKSQPPDGFKTRSDFYSATVLRKVLITQDFIQTIKNPVLKDVFKLAFGSTMVSYSNYSYEPSLGRRVSAGKKEIQDFPVEYAILEKLKQIAEDAAWVKERLRSHPKQVKVFNDSFFQYRNYLSPDSVDLIVTSPPYLNNYHYIRNTRPQMYWLEFIRTSGEMKSLEDANFGKYWQTVRDLDEVPLNFKLSKTDLADRLQQLRQLNAEKGIYGGNGWANYAAAYFNDCHTFAQGIKYALKPKGTALVVIGNSILQGLFIPTDQYFGKIAESVGLELTGIEIPRMTRVGSSIIQSDVRVGKAHASHQLYEAVVELRTR